MRRLAWFLFGAIALLVAVVVASGVVLTNAHGLTARERPSVLERWVGSNPFVSAHPRIQTAHRVNIDRCPRTILSDAVFGAPAVCGPVVKAENRYGTSRKNRCWLKASAPQSSVTHVLGAGCNLCPKFGPAGARRSRRCSLSSMGRSPLKDKGRALNAAGSDSAAFHLA
jgi:hypothetical protein